MTDFWYGVTCTIAIYLAFGWLLGNVFIAFHLARYFAAGWRLDLMLRTIMYATLFGPSMAFEWYDEARAMRAAERAAEGFGLAVSRQDIERSEATVVAGLDEDQPTTLWYGVLPDGRFILTAGMWPRHESQKRFDLVDRARTDD
jgi:hypothetical protein